MPHTSPDSNAHTLRQLEALAALAEIGPEQTERDIIQVGADVAQRATDSQVAYLHFLNEDEETIELGLMGGPKMLYTCCGPAKRPN